MEALLLIALFIFGPTLIVWIFRAMKAGATATITGQTFDEAMGNIPPMSVRLVDKTLDNKPNGFPYKAVEVKGLFPVSVSKEVAFVTSVFDQTDGAAKPQPVISAIEESQESTTPAFQQRIEIGRIQPNQGFTKWIEIGRIAPLFLQAPYSGDRVFNAYVRLLDSDNEPNILLGYPSGNEGIIWQNNVTFNHRQDAKGYREESEHRTESQALAVKLAMSVAMADGHFDDSEGSTIKAWITKSIAPYEGEQRENLKNTLNRAMKEAFEQSGEGNLSVSPSVARLNEIAEDNQKFEAMELCFDVMAADGKADTEEIQLLRRLGESLNLDMNELEKIRDHRMMNLSSSIESAGSMEDILGIDPSWDRAVVKKNFRKEFQKWNARINNLSVGDEKDHAQQMLNMIGEARKKYG